MTTITNGVLSVAPDLFRLSADEVLDLIDSGAYEDDLDARVALVDLHLAKLTEDLEAEVQAVGALADRLVLVGGVA